MSKKMKQKRNFNPGDFQFAVNIPQFILNPTSMKKFALVDFFMPLNIYFMNYIQKPLLTLFKIFGGPIGRMFGVGKPETKVIRLKEHLLTAHDGAKLCTDVYLPEKVFKEKSKVSTIVVRLPYWKNMACLIGYFLASKGYAVVLQDMRGCASSFQYGTFALTYFLRPDGFDTLKWIQKRFWYNGKIGTWGISFLGLTQLAVAWDNQGLITCMSPAACSFTSVLYDPGGLHLHGMGITVYLLISMITRVQPQTTSFFTEEGVGKAIEMYKNPKLGLYNDTLDEKRYLLRLKDLSKINNEEQIIAILNKTYNMDVKPNEMDKKGHLKLFMRNAVAGKTLELTKYEYLPYAFGFTGANMETPMYWVGSWHDMFVEQSLSDLKLIQKNSPKICKTNLKVVIGPGAHGGMDFMYIPYPPPAFIQIPNPKDMAALYQNLIPLWYYDYWLKQDGKDMSKVPFIRVWILNKRVWRHFKKWPPDTAETKLYLHSNGHANSSFGDGILSKIEPKNEKNDEFRFNPMDPVMTTGGRFLLMRSGRLNQAKLEKRPDILVYSTEPLKEGVEIIGEVHIVFYASSSAKDTDFTVKLVDVFNDRKALHVVDSGIRARFREGLDNPKLLEPGKIYKYEIKIGSTGYYFPKGHRIRIEISSSNFPRYDINANLGGEQNEKGFIIANQKIFHDSEHVSFITLPVYKPKS